MILLCWQHRVMHDRRFWSLSKIVSAYCICHRQIELLSQHVSQKQETKSQLRCLKYPVRKYFLGFLVYMYGRTFFFSHSCHQSCGLSMFLSQQLCTSALVLNNTQDFSLNLQTCTVAGEFFQRYQIKRPPAEAKRVPGQFCNPKLKHNSLGTNKWNTACVCRNDSVSTYTGRKDVPHWVQLSPWSQTPECTEDIVVRGAKTSP